MDIYLQELMKGHIQQKKEKVASDLSIPKNRFDIETDKEIEAYINTLDFEDTDPEKMVLVSKEMKRARVRSELQSQAKLPELTEYLTMAFKVLNSEASQILTEEEFLKLKSNFQEAEKYFDQMDLQIPATKTYKDILHIDKSTIDSIFKMAIEMFNQQLYSDSLSLFILLATIIPENADYWHRAGILASKCEKYELALRFFKAASSLDPDLIAPLIFSIDCLLQQKMEPEAKQMYSEAKQKNANMKSDSEENWGEVLSHFESMMM